MNPSERERWLLLIRAIVSAVVLGASLYVILGNSLPDATNKWAFGSVGIIIGYWLR
jgi:hypothetical protein